MGIIANDSIKIEGIDEKFDLRDLFIDVKPNEHGRAYLSIRVKDEGQPSNVVSSVKDKLITIKSTEADNSGVLFKGYVTFCDMNSVKSSGVVNLKLISTSIKMDEEFEYESHQKEGESLQKILQAAAKKSKGVINFFDPALASQTLEKPIIQYRETNWEFIKRIASRNWLPVIVDETADKPTLTIGYKKSGAASEEDIEKTGTTAFIRSVEYCTRKQNEKDSKVSAKDFNGVIVKSFKNLEIGNSVTAAGGSYIICAKQVKMENAHLVFSYEAGSEKLYGQEPICNEFLRGRCLEGKVVKTKDELIKVQLDLDKKPKPESELYEFQWKPETGNLMYTMPEKDTVVSLYVGGFDEGDAIVINSLRKDDGEDADEPNNKYFTTADKKRMYLKEKEAGFSNDAKDEGKNFIKLNDSDGISFDTSKDIYIEAKGDCNIKSGSKLTLSGNKLFQAKKGNNTIKINKKIDMPASKVHFNFGGATPEQLDEGEKVTLKTMDIMVDGQPLFIEKTKIYQLPLNLQMLVLAYEKFRGDQFTEAGSYNNSIPEDEREPLIAVNVNSTCALGENLGGTITSNNKYYKNLNDEERKMRRKLKKTRTEVPEIESDTIMQKVIRKEDIKKYTSGTYKSVGGCVAKAADAAPFCRSPKKIYGNLRLDFPNSEYAAIAEDTNGENFVLRFTSDKFPTNKKLPNRKNKNGPPCTESGFTGSDNSLVPEYFYNREESMITDGAIFMVDQQGNERIIAYFDGKQFQDV